jgi:D-lactate dehydrogenase (cytochrome)
MIIKTEQDEIQSYLSDAANIRGMCDAVCIAENESEIAELLKDANIKKYGVTVSGAGTGLTGGRVPESGKVISTEKLKTLYINNVDKVAEAGAGVLLHDLRAEAEQRQLFYPPDPTEKNCTIGANIATNASGARTFKYGPTREYVTAINVILPDGDMLKLRRGEAIADNNILTLTPLSGKIIRIEIPEIGIPDIKHAAGYFLKKGMDAIDLFIGAEGTLGIITGAALRLIALPKNLISCVLFFDEEKNALDFIASARAVSKTAFYRKPVKYADAVEDKNKMDFRCLEFFDFYSLEFLRADYPLIPQSSRAAVWLESEYEEGKEDETFEILTELILLHKGDEQNSWFAANEKDMRNIKKFRHHISVKVSEYLSAHNITKVGTDVAVPDDVFYKLYSESKTMVENAGLHYIVYGHFGNSHMHFNMLPKDAQEHAKAKKIYREIIRIAAGLGGTISAEHGIGKLKREYLIDMFGIEEVRKMAEIKKQLDPNLILNPGNIFDREIYAGL